MGFVYIIFCWLVIPVFYSLVIAEKIDNHFSIYRKKTAQTIWTFVDIFIIRFGYAYINFVFVAKVLFRSDVKMALIIGGGIFGFAIFCALLSALFSWLLDVRVISSTLVTIAALVIGYFTDNMAIAGAFLFISTTLIIIYAIIKKISKKR